MLTHHFHIEGQVQGVGFRPFVYRLAQALNLGGWVSNGVDGVHIVVTGSARNIELFSKRVRQEAPECADILYLTETVLPYQPFSYFEIRTSENKGDTTLLLTPDLGLCEHCRQELYDVKNRRHDYAFTTCTHCGPRYSIIRKLPYDRENTGMHDFEMCADCESEYHVPSNRRYYSQTNSCPNCAIELQLLNNDGDIISNNQKNIIIKAAELLHTGKILAVKGIGGYLLLADATNAETIGLLRHRKHRPTKPFALMYPDLGMLEKDVIMSAFEKEAYLSIESPIVLLRLKNEIKSAIQTNLIAPHLLEIGVMRPYTPLFELLCHAFGKPLIATSGNRSSAPIFYKNDDAIENLKSIADYFIINNRDIEVPQDESVVRFSEQHHQFVMIRRSRGFAPTFILENLELPEQEMLAMGADMKSAFSILHKNNVYISQYLGDLENYDTQNNFRHTLNHLVKLLHTHPDKVLVDAHPQYFSTKLGETIAELTGANMQSVQHHEAHCAAVLAENALLDTEEPVLGVVWDGTGWGTDGQIWGGEFFVYCHHTLKRVGHMNYFPHLLGDKMSKEPRLAALAVCRDLPQAASILKDKFPAQEWNLFQKMLHLSSNLQTSSMGRLFDAVASLLGLQDVSTFEGEAAMHLEALARTGYGDGKNFLETYSVSDICNTSAILEGILVDLQIGKDPAYIAANFHWSLAKGIQAFAESRGIHKIAFSGGVFQNTLLIDMIFDIMGDTHSLYFHQKLSPNDECISFGQLAASNIAQKQQTKSEMIEPIVFQE